MKITIVALCAVLGCASVGPVSRERPATILIQNTNWSLMRVSVIRNESAPYRIASVESESRAAVSLRADIGSAYRFVYSPLAGEAVFVTDPVSLLPGDTLRLNISNNLPFSSVFLTRP